jgi:hypothetical protein
MICTLTARRLQAGHEPEFRAAFERSAEELPKDAGARWTKVFVCRDVADPNVVLTFGLFDGTLEELRDIQAQADREGMLARLGPHVEAVLLDGSYEVLEEIEP